MSLVDSEPRSADVIASTDVELLTLDAKDLRKAIQLQPRLALSLIATLSRRLRQTIDRLQDLAFHDATHRVMRVLLNIATAAYETRGVPVIVGLHALRDRHRRGHVPRDREPRHLAARARRRSSPRAAAASSSTSSGCATASSASSRAAPRRLVASRPALAFDSRRASASFRVGAHGKISRSVRAGVRMEEP